MSRGLLKVCGLVALALVTNDVAIAEEVSQASADVNWTLFAPALMMGLAVFGGVFAQGKALSTALDSIGRNPSSGKGLFVPMLIGLAFIESLVVLGFVMAILMLNS